VAGHPGNKNAVKLTTPELKREAYRQYCQHLIEGWPKEAWCFEHPDMSLTWETIEKYIEEGDETDFPPILMKMAKAKRYKYWFGEGKTLMKGGYQNGSPVVWQTIMRNMFKEQKWDAKEIIQDNGPTVPTKIMIHDMDAIDAGSKLQSQTDSKLPEREEAD